MAITLLGRLAAGRLVCDDPAPWLGVDGCCRHLWFHCSYLVDIFHGRM